MRTATAALGTTMSRPSSLAGSHRVSLPISSQGAAKDCALSLTWSGRAAENAGLLKRQHRSRSQRRFPEDALVANVGCRRVSPVRRIPAIVSFLNPEPAVSLGDRNRSSCGGAKARSASGACRPLPAAGRGSRDGTDSSHSIAAAATALHATGKGSPRRTLSYTRLIRARTIASATLNGVSPVSAARRSTSRVMAPMRATAASTASGRSSILS